MTTAKWCMGRRRRRRRRRSRSMGTRRRIMIMYLIRLCWSNWLISVGWRWRGGWWYGDWIMIRWCLISSRLLDSLPRPRYPIPSQTALPCNTKPCSCSTISHHLTMPDYNQVKPYINQQAVLFKSRWVERMHGQTATFFDADDMTLILTMVQHSRPELWCFTLVSYSTLIDTDFGQCWEHERRLPIVWAILLPIPYCCFGGGGGGEPEYMRWWCKARAQ